MRLEIAAVAFAVVAGSGLGCKCKPANVVAGQSAPIDLAPLPEAPAIQVSPEAIPGAGGDLAVVQALPTGAARGAIRPTITFSKPVMALGTVEVEKTRAAPAVIEPALPGEWKWLGSASVEFVPQGLWPYSTRFTVTVAAGLVALDGTKLEKPYSFSFETPRPVVQQVEPRDGWEWITPMQPMAIVFNQGVADLASHLRLSVGDEAWPVKVVKETSLAEEKREGETGRRFDRVSFEERGFKDKRVRYEVAPGRPLPLAERVVTCPWPAMLRNSGPFKAPRKAT